MQRVFSSLPRRLPLRGVAGIILNSRSNPITVVCASRQKTTTSTKTPADSKATTFSTSAPRAPLKTAKAGTKSTRTPSRLDDEGAEQVRLAREMGEQAFGENTEILKKVAYRGLRAFAVCAFGVGMLMWAMKKKQTELETTADDPNYVSIPVTQAEDDNDPTKRYLEEMRGLGFDVDTLEVELEQERLAKAATASH